MPFCLNLSSISFVVFMRANLFNIWAHFVWGDIFIISIFFDGADIFSHLMLLNVSVCSEWQKCVDHYATAKSLVAKNRKIVRYRRKIDYCQRATLVLSYLSFLFDRGRDGVDFTGKVTCFVKSSRTKLDRHHLHRRVSRLRQVSLSRESLIL